MQQFRLLVVAPGCLVSQFSGMLWRTEFHHGPKTFSSPRRARVASWRSLFGGSPRHTGAVSGALWTSASRRCHADHHGHQVGSQASVRGIVRHGPWVATFFVFFHQGGTDCIIHVFKIWHWCVRLHFEACPFVRSSMSKDDIQQGEGGEQGDVFIPMLFSLGQTTSCVGGHCEQLQENENLHGPRLCVCQAPNAFICVSKGLPLQNTKCVCMCVTNCRSCPHVVVGRVWSDWNWTLRCQSGASCVPGRDGAGEARTCFVRPALTRKWLRSLEQETGSWSPASWAKTARKWEPLQSSERMGESDRCELSSEKFSATPLASGQLVISR